ncbi:hypothetical protein DL93DRAFT_2100330 [Clavulina sp. PMI_390]|nr:hypothetical protein DL93DRAFT_2100330 [Clavulina sp. PMI_390]
MVHIATALAAVALASASLASAAYPKGKRGLAWPSDNTFNPGVFAGDEVTWLYDWGLTAPSKLNGQYPFIPMQWNAANIATLSTTLKSEGATTVLGFNEPDNAGQANMLPSVAASYWKQYIQPLKAQGVTLVSPAFTYGGGITWMDQFVGNCTGCTFDKVACHWYGGGVADLTTYIESVEKYNKPIWLTEFALGWGDYTPLVSDYVAFLPGALEFLDNRTSVERYAFFGAFYSGSSWDMMTSSGGLSQLGQIYVNDSY